MQEEQWAEFLQRLEGPEGCNFKDEPIPDKPGETHTTWSCKGGMDKTRAKIILAKMEILSADQYAILRYVEELGGHCDCEIIFNAAERVYYDLGVEPNPYAFTPEQLEAIEKGE